MDGGIAQQDTGVSPREIEALNHLVVAAARRMSSDQIMVLIGAVHGEVRRRREAALAGMAAPTPGPRSPRPGRVT